MKKRTVIVAIAFAALSLGAASCEPEENAKIVVKNDLGFDVVELSLTGDADTGNLLGGSVPTIAKDQVASVPTEVAPGNYTWHVLYASGNLKPGDDGTEEFELFPGLNHVVLSVSPLL
jgi:hypothetical protein